MVETGSLKIGRRWFIQSKKERIEDVYTFRQDKDKLGSGTYGSVFKATHKITKDARAIKAIAKNKVQDPESFKSEVEIMRKLDHPNVIKLYETYEDSRHLYLVMELCKGGELFDRINEKGHYTEDEARRTFKQIMHAINYSHSNNIAHRDLKPENFLYLTGDEDSPLKVIDFGLSKVFKEEGNSKAMSTRAGTPFYISPEVLKGKYDQSCDIWSLGVILYIILCGYPPFYGETDREILEAVNKGEFDFEGEEWDEVTEEAKDLIRKMITKPEKRLTAQKVLEHPWMQKKSDKKSTHSVNITQLRNFMGYCKLKKAVLTFMASQLSENEIIELGRIFVNLDANGDGTLTLEELADGLQKLPDFDPKEVQSMMSSIDTDKSGKVDYTEFLAATMERNLYLKEERLYAAFKMFDKDGNGTISASELREVLGNSDMLGTKDDSFWNELLKEADTNGDGEIDYAEFVAMMGTGKK
eukprot:CAMPEP_0176441590 /NCGR_PEP_ID=MMETSP0127-20121128/21290_1 /TAXON_ID=938130 /ORGANISM="Platyophrya macrostoma, Strain WH" /LENGTH=469 /DNA_ID=CAMNT_0017826401 /DNA_START=25 /DNA_END=1434 /DNA_ORIENTATION=+